MAEKLLRWLCSLSWHIERRVRTGIPCVGGGWGTFYECACGKSARYECTCGDDEDDD